MPDANNKWTYDEVRGAITDNLELQGKPFVNLDVFQSGEDNIRDIIAWANTMGYDAEFNKTSACVMITKKIV